MKCLFVINPVSGTQAFHKSLNTFIGDLILQTDVNQVDTYYTKGNNDAFERCRAVKKGDYDFVVSVGGDGTVNECLGGIIKSGSETPVALIPAGTVNDFANYFSITHDSKDNSIQILLTLNILGHLLIAILVWPILLPLKK